MLNKHLAAVAATAVILAGCATTPPRDAVVHVQAESSRAVTVFGKTVSAEAAASVLLSYGYTRDATVFVHMSSAGDVADAEFKTISMRLSAGGFPKNMKVGPRTVQVKVGNGPVVPVK